MPVLKSIKKEKEERDKFIIQNNEVKLLNQILSGKSKLWDLWCIIAETSDFLKEKVSPNNKYFIYSQMMYQKDPTFRIDYKKNLQILNRKMQKQQVQVHLEWAKDPKLQKLKAKM